jgi:hypothetical protein
MKKRIERLKDTLYGVLPWLILFTIPIVIIVSKVYYEFSDISKSREEPIHTYDTGYEYGYDVGYDAGYDAGYDDGYNEGNDTGYNEGYSDGETDGYYAGATYTCLFFGDVDRAFQSARKGIAWYTFIDAYDQYISNIYNDNDTRSELFWTLYSAVLGNDLTEDEIDLLISTFGTDLFTRNGITLN